MKMEIIIRADELDNANEIVDFFRNSEFDAELVMEDRESMSGHVVKVKCIKVTRKE